MKKLLILSIFVLSFAYTTAVLADTCPAGTVQQLYQSGLTVPSNGSSVNSSILFSGETYLVEAAGTYRFANWGDYGIADAEWAYRNAPYYPTDPAYVDVVPDAGGTSGWVKGEGYYVSLCGLDLQMGGCVDWGDFNPSHVYSLIISGGNVPMDFYIYDNAYGDNSGSLNVDIYLCNDDVDGDGIVNSDDNCPETVNPGQDDLDENGIGNACDLRYAEIASPAAGEHILGDLNLLAYLVDNDNDPVQWAVRKDSCAANTNTVIGNVDGKNTPYNWVYDSAAYLHTFTATVNTCGWEPGEYYHCFVFNPTEDAGETPNLRPTQQFHIDDCDKDDDGYDYTQDCDDYDDTIYPGATEVCDVIDNDCDGETDEDVDMDLDGVEDCSADVCIGNMLDTTVGLFSDPWGVHRWYYNGDDWVQQPNPKGQVTPGKSFTLDDTYGCGCYQILEMLKAAGLGQFGGHYKFGCSTSILDDFKLDMSDGVLDGRYFIETVTIPAKKSTDTLSNDPLTLGINYILKARGTANAGDGITFDARYSYRIPTSATWTDAVSTYEGYGVTLLDLFYNGITPWGDYNASHEYEATMPGTGLAATFRIHDVYYPNNTGNLYVDIYAML